MEPRKLENMINRLARLIVGLIVLATIPVALVLSLVLWALTGEFYLSYIFNWIIFNEFDND